jgi:uncharacterized membrane protein
VIVEHSTLIHASPDRVWAVTVDLEQWPAWTPTVTRVTRVDDGPLRVGSAARIKQPGMRECLWRVTELREGEGFTWETRVFGMTMIATHEIRKVEAGTTNTLRLQVRGVTARLLWPLMRSKLRHTLACENAGLQAEAEG